MDGIDLLIHRHENDIKNGVKSSTLYIFKIHCFCEMVLENQNSSVEIDDALLISTLDGKYNCIYILKETKNPQPLKASI